MSGVTFLAERQKALEVLAAGANVAYTEVDCSAFVPEGTTAIVVMTELEQNGPPTAGDYATSTKRKDAAQGVCSQDTIPYHATVEMVKGDNGIIPLTAARKFEYDLNGVWVTLTVDLRVYIIGYTL